MTHVYSVIDVPKSFSTINNIDTFSNLYSLILPYLYTIPYLISPCVFTLCFISHSFVSSIMIFLAPCSYTGRLPPYAPNIFADNLRADKPSEVPLQSTSEN